MIKIKNEGVRARIAGLKPEILLAIQIAYSVWPQHIDMVITSGTELGDFRKKGSKHLSGQAIDIRTHGLDRELVYDLTTFIQDALGTDYDVVLESNHIHIEFDPSP